MSDTPPQAGRSVSARFRFRPWWVIAVAGVVLVVGAGVVFGGADEAEPEAACEGVVDGGGVAKVLGGGELREVTAPFSVAGDWVVECGLERELPEGAGVGSVEFRVGWSGDVPALGDELGRLGSRAAPAVPLGRGWDGAVLPKNGTFSNVVLRLACEQRADDLVVLVRGTHPGDGLRTPRGNKLLAEVATSTARGAAKKWGCRATAGGPVGAVPVGPGGWVKAKPLGEADGACRPFRDLPRDLRKRLGVSTVRETPAGRTPVSDCYLAGDDGRARYWAGAQEEPFTNAVTARGRETASLTCDARNGQVYARVAPARDHTLAMGDRKRLLEAFTRAEAARYGCGEPEFRW